VPITLAETPIPTRPARTVPILPATILAQAQPTPKTQRAIVPFFIDGQELLKDGYTSNHIYAIEAHEIAHYILQHDKDNPSIEQEKSADVAAIEILEFLKHYEAKNLLIRRFTLLYTCDPNKDDILSPKEKELLISYLKERDNSLMAKIKRFILKFKK
jgi:hypothetical protein